MSNIEDMKGELARLNGAGQVDADPEHKRDVWQETFQKIDSRYQQYVDRENSSYKLCSDCYRKQALSADRCELCSATGPWLPAVDPQISSEEAGRRARWVAAATTFTPDQLERYIAKTHLDLPYAAHCARVRELKGLPKVRSYWERAGFDFYGQPVGGREQGAGS